MQHPRDSWGATEAPARGLDDPHPAVGLRSAQLDALEKAWGLAWLGRHTAGGCAFDREPGAPGSEPSGSIEDQQQGLFGSSAHTPRMRLAHVCKGLDTALDCAR